jgi:DNA repair protein RadC
MGIEGAAELPRAGRRRRAPEKDGPPARLLRLGPEALSSPELIATLISPARTADGDGLRAGGRLLDHFGTLRDLGGAHWTELAAVSGVGPRGAAALIAAFELGRRIQSSYLEGRTEVRSPDDVARLLADMRYLDREHFRVLLLDTKNRLLAIETVAVGTLNASLVHPREVLKPAIRRSAAALILAHNHPSGVPEPSTEDVELTRRFAESGRIVGIEVLDHIIIGDRGYRSLREAGVL